MPERTQAAGIIPYLFVRLAYGEGWVPCNDILMILSPAGRPGKKMRELFADAGKTIDLTHGTPTRSMVILKQSGYMVLSPFNALTIINAMEAWIRTRDASERKR